MIDGNLIGIISSVMVDEKAINPIEVGGNLRLDPHEQLGLRYFQLNQNPRIQGARDFILQALENDHTFFPITLVINKAILDDSELLSAIQEKLRKQNRNCLIRIADEGYVLTREDYQKLSFATDIIVDECDASLENDSHIILQHGVFKFDLQGQAQPVLERRKAFDEMVLRNAFHITHPLSEEEFEFLARSINAADDASIELDYFDPHYYYEFLEGLRRHHVKDNINIQLIGYLLQDNLATFSALESFPYEIDVVYSTCHDMVDRYQKEPFTENRLYYSQIEGGGKTSLTNYLNVLEEVETFELIVQRGNFSPLEAAVFAKMEIDNEYIYDPDVDISDQWDNINLSQMIHHEVDGKKRAICMGFSTLYSALLRRSGIPMFRYSTTGHSRNIGRIQDEKYDVDTITASDLTWDLLSDNGNLPTYTRFMVAPREYTKLLRSDGNYEHMTIADALSLPFHDYYGNLINTNLYYEVFYHPVGYEPMGYAARMLELMGEGPKEGIGIDVYEEIYRLCEEGHFESIPQEKILQAINRVLEFLQINPEQREVYANEVRGSFAERSTVFNASPAIGSDQDGVSYPVTPLTRENVGELRRQLPENRPRYYMEVPDEVNTNTQDQQPTETVIPNPTVDPSEYSEDYIPGTNIHRPRERGIYETDEEYVEFLRGFYERHFPHNHYISELLTYVEERNITVYDYYVQVADCYCHQQDDAIPAFERDNPFVKEEDIRLLVESEDTRMPLFFAGTLSKVVERNLSERERDQLSAMFVDTVEKYNEEVGYRI